MKRPAKAANNLRSRQTDAERLLWRHLCNRQIHGHKFHRQHPIRKYIVDFVGLEKKLITELDGGQHMEQQVYDRQRTDFLEAEGYTVLRYWNVEVLGNIEAVLGDVLGVLSACSTPHLLGERVGVRSFLNI